MPRDSRVLRAYSSTNGSGFSPLAERGRMLAESGRQLESLSEVILEKIASTAQQLGRELV
jgi:hypothetical protein